MPKPEPTTGTTHFGYQEVPADEKAGLVRGVFDSVATRYDVMNDLMSGGLHRLWKRHTVARAAVREGQFVLDLAGGTGDLARAFARRAGSEGCVVLADINRAMLEQGRRRLVDAGVGERVSIVQVDAENLPFADGSFDCISIAFGLRNITDKGAALRSMFRTLRPGGKLLILEFSRPGELLRPAYDLYSFRILPLIGRYVAGDEASYQYLAESIRMHPDQETLKAMLEDAGFERCGFENLAGGIVALHSGYRI
jgi:demethylmenaquinone methyltransferase/2-methoxy-6-polyprenyl-1,4-benzoquinol methylase